MFHVATLMPNNENSEDLKLEKKRHVGNDVVTIVFLDSGASFDPTSIRTQYTQAFLLVSPMKHNNRLYFRMQVVSRDGIGSFGPSMPACLFPRSQETRSFILTKLINAERAAMETPLFADKNVRARLGILRDIIQQHRQTRSKRNKAILKKETSQKAIARPVASVMSANRVQRRPSLSAMDLAIPVRFASQSPSSADQSVSPPESAKGPKKSPSSSQITSSSESRDELTSPRIKKNDYSASLLSPDSSSAEKKKSKHKRQKSQASINSDDLPEDQQ